MKTRKIIALAAALTLSSSAIPCTSAYNNTVSNIKTDAIIFGDANADKTVNGNDALTIIQYFLYCNTEKAETVNISLESADVNRSGEIELTDLATVKRYSVGDSVTMGGRSVNVKGAKAENERLLKVKNQFIINCSNASSAPSYAFSADTYENACTRLHELGVESPATIMDKVNIPGAPNYDGVKNYDVAIIMPLEYSSVADLYAGEPSDTPYPPEECEIWANVNGLDFRNKPGTHSCVAVYIVNINTLYELSNDFNSLLAIDFVQSFRNGKLILSGIVVAKPVIYLYPEVETDVHVELDYDGKLACTYPEYPEDGWDVTAQPDGTLTDKDGYEYSYLYWEGKGDDICDMSEGFVIKGEDTASFLREKLSYMGLTPREYNEFIVYWLPLMENNPYNLVSFQFDNYTETAKLSITPEPDSMQRVFMAYQSLDEYVDVPEQELPTFERKGFTVVEWGGTEVK